MFYTLAVSDIVLVSTCKYGVNSGVNRILLGERDIVELKPFFLVDTNTSFEARIV